MNQKPSDYLTSEFLYHALKGNPSYRDRYLAAYRKRLETFGLTEKEIDRFRNLDEKAILLGCYINTDNPLTAKPFIKSNMTKKSINVNNCTMSELVYLIEETNKAFVNFDFWENTPAKDLILQHTFYYCINEAAYVIRYRLMNIGLSLEQINNFIKNECSIIHKAQSKNAYVTL